MRTIVYVDGFNLYYGSLKGTPHKWLDLEAIFSRVLARHHDIVKIKYFTARVSDRVDNVGIASRQDTYIRALAAWNTKVEPIYGQYKLRKRRMPLVEPPPKTIEVWSTEEKGSDVNLAVHMVHDACTGAMDAAVLVSNDSDLSAAVRLVKQSLQKTVIHIVPGQPPNRFGHSELKRWAKASFNLMPADLAACQLPNPIPGIGITKPPGW